MTRHSNPIETIVALDTTEPSHRNDDDERDDDEEQDPPLGEPFALAMACDLLPQSHGIPGCWASVRCDCGRSFKLDLLSEGMKPCPGCRVLYSHCLLVAPADDTEITTAFFDAIHGEPQYDDEQQVSDDDGQEDDEESKPNPFDTSSEDE